MIVDCAHYRDGHRHDGKAMDIARVAEISRQENERGFVWIGLVEPDAGELAAVQRQFGLNELAVEDAQSFHLRRCRLIANPSFDNEWRPPYVGHAARNKAATVASPLGSERTVRTT